MMVPSASTTVKLITPVNGHVLSAIQDFWRQKGEGERVCGCPMQELSREDAQSFMVPYFTAFVPEQFVPIIPPTLADGPTSTKISAHALAPLINSTPFHHHHHYHNPQHTTSTVLRTHQDPPEKTTRSPS